MADLKVFARRAIVAAAFVGFFSAASALAYHAAGAAVSIGSYAVPR